MNNTLLDVCLHIQYFYDEKGIFFFEKKILVFVSDHMYLIYFSQTFYCTKHSKICISFHRDIIPISKVHKNALFQWVSTSKNTPVMKAEENHLQTNKYIWCECIFESNICILHIVTDYMVLKVTRKTMFIVVNSNSCTTKKNMKILTSHSVLFVYILACVRLIFIYTRFRPTICATRTTFIYYKI